MHRSRSHESAHAEESAPAAKIPQHPLIPRNTAELIQSDILATRGAALIDVLLIVGIVFAVLLADRVGRIRLQIIGFIGCAAGLLLAALSLHIGGVLASVLLFAGFAGFGKFVELIQEFIDAKLVGIGHFKIREQRIKMAAEFGFGGDVFGQHWNVPGVGTWAAVRFADIFF
jgi:hypothetical protein